MLTLLEDYFSFKVVQICLYPFEVSGLICTFHTAVHSTKGRGLNRANVRNGFTGLCKYSKFKCARQKCTQQAHTYLGLFHLTICGPPINNTEGDAFGLWGEHPADGWPAVIHGNSDHTVTARLDEELPGTIPKLSYIVKAERDSHPESRGKSLRVVWLQGRTSVPWVHQRQDSRDVSWFEKVDFRILDSGDMLLRVIRAHITCAAEKTQREVGENISFNMNAIMTHSEC